MSAGTPAAGASADTLAETLRRGPIASAVRALEAGSVTSVALTEACLQAARRLQPALTAFIETRADQALGQARLADAERAQGRVRGPLHGIPLAHKDIFFRPGQRTTAGSRVLAEFRPQAQAAVLERLDASGAVDIGTLNLSEFCVGPTGQNDHAGSCRNPWDTARIAGGSSSGSAAAVAAGIVFGSIGSDTGGSIRLPAAVCGATGLKPSYGRVSLRGAIERCWSLDVFGPIARSVEDVALLLSAVAGFDAEDPCSRAAAVPDYPALLHADGRLRIAVCDSIFAGMQPAVAAAHRQALQDLGAAGCELVPAVLPDPQRLYGLTTVINDVEAAFLHRDTVRARPQDYNGSTRSRVDRGDAIAALDYLAAVRARPDERRSFEQAVLAGCDALYLPVLDMEVPRLAEVAFSEAQEANAIVPRLTRWTRWISYLGLPALAMPVGVDGAGMPVACQLVGRYFDEPSVLRVGARFQRATGWHERQAPLC